MSEEEKRYYGMEVIHKSKTESSITKQKLLELRVEPHEIYDDETVVRAVISGGSLATVNDQTVFDAVVEVIMVRWQHYLHLLKPNQEIRLAARERPLPVLEYVAVNKFLTADEKKRFRNRGDVAFYVNDRRDDANSFLFLRWKSYDSRATRLVELQAIVSSYMASNVLPMKEVGNKPLTDVAFDSSDDNSRAVNLSKSCQLWALSQIIAGSATFSELTFQAFPDSEESSLKLILKGYLDDHKGFFYKLEFGSLIIGLSLQARNGYRYKSHELLVAAMIQIRNFSQFTLQRTTDEDLMQQLQRWLFDELGVPRTQFVENGIPEEFITSGTPCPLFDDVDLRYQTDATAASEFPFVTASHYRLYLQYELDKMNEEDDAYDRWSYYDALVENCEFYANKQHKMHQNVSGYFESTPHLYLTDAQPVHLEALQPTPVLNGNNNENVAAADSNPKLKLRQTQRGICRRLQVRSSGALFKPYGTTKPNTLDSAVMSSLQAFLRREGFAVVRGLLSKKIASAIRSEMWELLSDLYVGDSTIKQNKLSTWKNMPKPASMGLLNIEPSYHLNSTWTKLRQNKRLYDLFSELMSTGESSTVSLSPSIEGIATTHRQKSEGNSYPYRWNLKRNKRVKYRGLLALDDMTGEDAALLLVPGFHTEAAKTELLGSDKELSKRSQLHGHINVDGKSYRGAPESIVQASEAFDSKVLCIPMKKGDIVIWDYRLPYTWLRNSESNVTKFAQFITFVKSDCSDEWKTDYGNLLKKGGLPERDLDGMKLSDLPTTNTRTNAPNEYKKPRNADWVWAKPSESARKKKWMWAGYKRHSNEAVWNERWSWDSSAPIVQQTWKMRPPSRMKVITPSYQPPQLSEFGSSLLRGVPCDDDDARPSPPPSPPIPVVVNTEKPVQKKKRKRAEKEAVPTALSTCTQRALERIAAEQLLQLFRPEQYEIENLGQPLSLPAGSVYVDKENMVITGTIQTIAARPKAGDTVHFVLYMKVFDEDDNRVILHKTKQWKLTSSSVDATVDDVTRLIWMKDSVRNVRFSLPLSTMIDSFVDNVFSAARLSRKRIRQLPSTRDPFNELFEKTSELISDLLKVYDQPIPDSAIANLLKLLENIEAGIQKNVSSDILLQAITDAIELASSELSSLSAESEEAAVLRSVRNDLSRAKRNFLEGQQLFENFKRDALSIFEDFMSTALIQEQQRKNRSVAKLSILAAGAINSLLPAETADQLLKTLDAVDGDILTELVYPMNTEATLAAQQLRRTIVTLIDEIKSKTEASIVVESDEERAYRMSFGLANFLGIGHAYAAFGAMLLDFINTEALDQDTLKNSTNDLRGALIALRDKLDRERDTIVLEQTLSMLSLVDDINDMIASSVELTLQEEAMDVVEEAVAEQEVAVFSSPITEEEDSLPLSLDQDRLQQEMFARMDEELEDRLSRLRTLNKQFTDALDASSLPPMTRMTLEVQLEGTVTTIEDFLSGEAARCTAGEQIDSLRRVLTNISKFIVSSKVKQQLFSTIEAMEALVNEVGTTIVPPRTTTTQEATQPATPITEDASVPDFELDGLIERGEEVPEKMPAWKAMAIEEEEEEESGL